MASHLLGTTRVEKMIQNFNALIDYVFENSTYYQELYKEKIEVETLEDLMHVPFSQREHLFKGSNPLNELCKSKKELVAYFETSGSTGNALPLFPDLSHEKLALFGEFLDFWMGLKNARIDAAVVALPYEMNPMGLKYHMALSSLGITVIPTSVRSTLCPPKKMISLIQNLKPGLLIGRPLEVMRYAEGMQALGIDPSMCSIRKIFLTGETMSSAKWRRIEKLYGDAEIFSTYGLTEIDSGLTSCSQHHYHLPPTSSLITEVVDEQGNWVQEDVLGEIIFTNLEKNFFPLVRYQTKDMGYFQQECSCEEFDTPHVVVLGRKADKRKIGKVSIFPVQIENILFSMKEIGCEYQLIYNQGKLTIHLEKSIEFNECESEIISEKVKNRLSKLEIEAEVVVFDFNQLADKLGIAKTKACRFFDISGLDDETAKKKLQINYIDGSAFDEN